MALALLTAPHEAHTRPGREAPREQARQLPPVARAIVALSPGGMPWIPSVSTTL